MTSQRWQGEPRQLEKATTYSDEARLTSSVDGMHVRRRSGDAAVNLQDR